MNVKELKKNVGWWLRFRPDVRGLTIPDAEWLIESVDEGKKMVRVSLPATGHFVELEGDHIHSFMKDSHRRGPEQHYGFLILRVELTVDGDNIHFEPLPPNSPGVSNWTTEDKTVNDKYLDSSGLRSRYTSLRWSDPDKIANFEAGGYRVVLEENRISRIQYRLVRRGDVLVGKSS